MTAAPTIIEYQLSANHVAIIYTLHRKGGVKMADLAREVGVTEAGLTGLVDALEKRGIVERKLSDFDRRVKAIQLTAKGNDVAAKL